MGVGLFSQVTSESTRGSGLQLLPGKLRLDAGNIFFMVRVWNRLLAEVVESPIPEGIYEICECGV